MWTDEFMELTLLNECIRCLSACGQCKFDVVHAHTSIHRHTRSYASTQERSTHFSWQIRDKKQSRLQRVDSSFRIGMARFMHSGRQCGFAATTAGWPTSRRIVSVSSWLDKSAHLSAPRCTYAQQCTFGYRTPPATRRTIIRHRRHFSTCHREDFTPSAYFSPVAE